MQDIEQHAPQRHSSGGTSSSTSSASSCSSIVRPDIGRSGIISCRCWRSSGGGGASSSVSSCGSIAEPRRSSSGRTLEVDERDATATLFTLAAGEATKDQAVRNEAAAVMGMPRQTAYHWWKRGEKMRAEAMEGLAEWAGAPKRLCSRAISEEDAERAAAFIRSHPSVSWSPLLPPLLPPPLLRLLPPVGGGVRFSSLNSAAGGDSRGRLCAASRVWSRYSRAGAAASQLGELVMQAGKELGAWRQDVVEQC